MAGWTTRASAALFEANFARQGRRDGGVPR